MLAPKCQNQRKRTIFFQYVWRIGINILLLWHERKCKRNLHSIEYDEYYASLDEKTKAKYDYVEMIIKTQYVVNKKFVKNLEETEFYEARVSVGNNEYRTIIFAVETLSFVESKRVLFLNSFLKKGTKQYKGEIEIARHILKKYI